jgi:hypothetical protein
VETGERGHDDAELCAEQLRRQQEAVHSIAEAMKEHQRAAPWLTDDQTGCLASFFVAMHLDTGAQQATRATQRAAQ